MVILGISGQPFNVFKLNNKLGLDISNSIKEPKLADGYSYRMLFYIIPIDEVTSWSNKLKDLYLVYKAQKEPVIMVSDDQYKYDTTLFYIVDITQPSKLSEYTMKKLIHIETENTKNT